MEIRFTIDAATWTAMMGKLSASNLLWLMIETEAELHEEDPDEVIVSFWKSDVRAFWNAVQFVLLELYLESYDWTEYLRKDDDDDDDGETAPLLKLAV